MYACENYVVFDETEEKRCINVNLKNISECVDM
jgi:hypothetical protein